MKRISKVVLVALAVLAAAEVIARARRPSRAVAEGAPAPDFTLRSIDGREVTLSKLRGRVVAVNFWATWCPPCKAEIPDLAAVYTANRERCLEVLGVAEDSGAKEEVSAAAASLGINYPVLLDSADGAVSELFRVAAYPRTFLLDGEGKVRKVFSGAVQRSELEGALAPLLAEVGGGCRAPI